MCLIPPHQQKVAGQENLNNSLFGVPMHPFPQVPLLLHYSTIPYLRIQQRTLTQTLLQNYCKYTNQLACFQILHLVV